MDGAPCHCCDSQCNRIYFYSSLIAEARPSSKISFSGLQIMSEGVNTEVKVNNQPGSAADKESEDCKINSLKCFGQA